MVDIELLFLLLPLAMLVALVLGVMGFIRARDLELRVQLLEAELARRGRQQAAVKSEASPVVDAAQPAPAAQKPAADAQDETVVLAPHTWQHARPQPAPAVSSAVSSSLPREPGLADRLLENIRSNWMIWLGGLCVGLAGVFMVRYSIEQGLLGPQARVVLSLLAGIGLHGAAEWLRRNKGVNPVFAALAGGASIILYAALFAAFKLLPGLAPWLIFAALALVSFATLALALRHGPVLAALGMLGGYLVPLLVSSGSGRIELALLYIWVLTLFSLWLLAYVQRRWLWLGVIGGSLVWWGISLLAEPAEGVRSLYLLGLAYLLLAVPRFDWLLQSVSEVLSSNWWQHLLSLRRDDPAWPVLPALILIVLAQALTLMVEGVTGSSLFTVLALPGLLLLVASRRPELNLPLVVHLLLLVAAIVLPLLTDTSGVWILSALSADQQAALAIRLVCITALFSGVALWWLWQGVRYPAFWTGLAAGAPLLMLATAYYLLTAIPYDWVWGLSAALLGVLYVWLAQRGQAALSALQTVLLISAGHIGVSLAAVIVLAEATLTLALAAQLVSLALLQRRYQLPLLSWVIRLVLLLVVVRLTLNPWLLSYGSDTHWSLWTFGGSALCAGLAAWILRAEVNMQPWLQGGTAHLLVLTLAAEVRYWLYDGDIFRHEFSVTEASLNVMIWGTAALLYFWRAAVTENLPRFYRTVATLHLAAAGFVYLTVLMLAENPLWSYLSLGSTPLWNLLLLSYGVPTVLLALLWWQTQRGILPAAWSRPTALATGLNLLWFVSLEIRHLWQFGLDADAAGLQLYRATSVGELYTYSVVWLGLAATALTLGNWLGNRSLYQGGMVLLLVVVAKLFLIDMAGLTGLWRVASFMGLGLALLALAWLHQRFGGRLQAGST